MGNTNNKHKKTTQKKTETPAFHDFPPSTYVEVSSRSPVMKIPTVFRWKYGGKRVYLVGTMTENKPIPLTYNSEENAFVIILNIAPGRHKYRFVVDGELRTDPHVKRISSTAHVSNYIEVGTEEQLEQSKNWKGSSDSNDTANAEQAEIGLFQSAANATSMSSLTASDSTAVAETIPKTLVSEYGEKEVQFVENKRTIALLPPHLRYTPLNGENKYERNPELLPKPLHVTVNHAYFASKVNDDGIILTGVTTRYKNKFATMVMYSCSSDYKKKSQKKSIYIPAE